MQFDAFTIASTTTAAAAAAALSADNVATAYKHIDSCTTTPFVVTVFILIRHTADQLVRF